MDISVQVGDTALLSVTAISTTPLTFNWLLNGKACTNSNASVANVVVPLVGTVSTLTVTGVNSNNAGYYSVQIVNSAGSVTSSIVSLAVAGPPVFTTEPQNQIVFQGQNATFSGVTISTTSVGYQWTFNGNAIPGATNASLTVTNVQAANTGTYVLVATNSMGANLSTPATLTLNPLLQITTEPQSQGVAQGQTVSFSAVASGTSTFYYQWYFGGTKLGGSSSTSSTLTLNNVNPNNAGNYFLVVTNSYGSVTSTVATLTVYVLPGIQSQPQNETVLQGANATFSVVTNNNGTPPFSYQWNVNGTNVVDGPAASGAQNPTLVLSNVQPAEAGNVVVVITNYAGSITSQVATLTVNVPAMITAQPQSSAVVAGQNAAFSVSAIGTGNLQYQWYFDNASLAGGQSQNSTLSLSPVTTNNAGTYYVVVKNNFGMVTSAVVSLTELTTQPVSQTVAVGANVNLFVGISNPVPVSIQWSDNGTNLYNATNATLTLTNVPLSASGSYQATITTPGGVLNSSVATLTVLNGWVGVVTNTSDSGAGSFRQALLNSNTNTVSPCTIVFNIPGSGPFTISALSPMPVITNSVTIDATTEPTFASTNQPVIQLDGNSLPNNAADDGLTINASGCTIKGLDISRFPGNGITLTAGSNNVIQGNFIGCALDGANKQPNRTNGIAIYNSAGNYIGGTNSLQRNVVVDAGGDGIHIEGPGSTGNQVLGNLIGLDQTGLIAEGISGNGITLTNAVANTIGGTNAGSGNVITSHGGDGVDLNGYETSFNSVLGNFIGTDVTGTNIIKCNGNGITIFESASNTIGGLALPAANVISGNNQNGIAISGSTAVYNVVEGNFIGTDLSDTLNLKNNQAGVLTTATINNTIGGTTPGAGNCIAYNGGGGVVVNGGQTAILGNSLYSNGGPGDINLLNSGNLNAVLPTLTSVSEVANLIGITGSLTNYPGKTYRIEFYASPNAADAKTFIGTANLTTSVGGIAAFSAILDTGNLGKQYITAIATDSSGNSSTISTPLVVGSSGAPFIFSNPINLTSFTGSSGSLSVVAGGTPAPAYQWFFQGSPVPNATNATLAFSPLRSANNGSYYVVVTNSFGSATSAVVNVTATNPVVTISTSAAGPGSGLTSGGFTFQFSLPAGETYVVLASTDLVNWTPISTNIATSASIAITDAAASDYTRRYYRVMIPQP